MLFGIRRRLGFAFVNVRYEILKKIALIMKEFLILQKSIFL
jgi:hypothetical protein